MIATNGPDSVEGLIIFKATIVELKAQKCTSSKIKKISFRPKLCELKARMWKPKARGMRYKLGVPAQS